MSHVSVPSVCANINKLVNSLRLLIVTIAALCGCFWADRASAVLVQAPVEGFPAVNATNGFSAVRATITVKASSPAGFESFAETYTDYSDGDFTVFASEGQELGVSGPQPNQEVDSFADGSAGFGILRGSASALLRSPLANATAHLVLLFIDRIHINSDGYSGSVPFDIDFKADGVVKVVKDSNLLLHPEQGSITAGANSQFWIWPDIGPLPSAGATFNALRYNNSVWSAGASVQGTKYESVEMPVGTNWWIAGRLELQTGGFINSYLDLSNPDAGAHGEVNFSDTLEFFIDPSLDAPAGVFITSASAQDYRTPVPEPGTMLLLACAMGAVMPHRRSH